MQDKFSCMIVRPSPHNPPTISRLLHWTAVCTRMRQKTGQFSYYKVDKRRQPSKQKTKTTLPLPRTLLLLCKNGSTPTRPCNLGVRCILPRRKKTYRLHPFMGHSQMAHLDHPLALRNHRPYLAQYHRIWHRR